MNQLKFINYSKYFNNNLKAYQTLSNNSLSSSDYIQNMAVGLSIDLKKLAIPNQIHSNTVTYISKGGSYSKTDGLITDNNEIILSLQTADCVPIFLFDKKNNVKGLIHSGWKGTKDKIINNAINLMLCKGSLESNILVVLGASIHKCCYEVGEEILNYFDEQSTYRINNKFYLSLQEQILIDLSKLYISEKNIFIDKKCTFMDNKLNSYRRDGKSAGRMISLLGHY